MKNMRIEKILVLLVNPGSEESFVQAQLVEAGLSFIPPTITILPPADWCSQKAGFANLRIFAGCPKFRRRAWRMVAKLVRIALGVGIAVLMIGGPVGYWLYKKPQVRNFRIVQEGVLYRSGQ